jgi:hypothetical protein
MENENVLDQQTEEVTEEVAEEPTEEAEDAEAAEAEAEAETEPTEEDESASEDEFEYDENGDIIIPDGIEEESPSDGGENVAGAADARDDENARLREELEELRFRTKDALKKLGVDTEDVLDGLAEIASESADVSKEDYNAELEKAIAKAMKEKREADAKRIADFEALAAKDLAELQQIYPDTKAYKHVRDMPEEVLKKFAQYRNMGLPAKDAYAAANVEGIRKSTAEVAKRKAMNDNKAHLQASSPKSAKGNGIRIPAKEMEMWRGMFPDKSDKEIATLYKKTL